jgi:hypothetical protein
MWRKIPKWRNAVELAAGGTNESMQPDRRHGCSMDKSTYNNMSAARLPPSWPSLDRLSIREAQRVATRTLLACLTPWQKGAVALMVARCSTAAIANAKEAVIAQCRELLGHHLDYGLTGPRKLYRCGSECQAHCFRRALLPRHVLRRRGVVELARQPYVRDSHPSPGGKGSRREGRRMGA